MHVLKGLPVSDRCRHAPVFAALCLLIVGCDASRSNTAGASPGASVHPERRAPLARTSTVRSIRRPRAGRPEIRSATAR
jgi:hypothetical protein